MEKDIVNLYNKIIIFMIPMAIHFSMYLIIWNEGSKYH